VKSTLHAIIYIGNRLVMHRESPLCTHNHERQSGKRVDPLVSHYLIYAAYMYPTFVDTQSLLSLERLSVYD
jgi:hypothetical protein